MTGYFNLFNHVGLFKPVAIVCTMDGCWPFKPTSNYLNNNHSVKSYPEAMSFLVSVIKISTGQVGTALGRARLAGIYIAGIEWVLKQNRLTGIR